MAFGFQLGGFGLVLELIDIRLVLSLFDEVGKWLELILKGFEGLRYVFV
jgi:hypothetical protein